MHRRTILKTGVVGLITGFFPQYALACACGGSARHIPVDLSQTDIGKDLPALLDLHYGLGNWLWEKHLSVKIMTPDFAENETIVPVGVILEKLPDGYTELVQMDFFTEGTLLITRDERITPLRIPTAIKLASAQPAGILPASFRARYRRFNGLSQLYVALRLRDNNANIKTLVYRHPNKLKAGYCGWVVYVDPGFQHPL